MCSSKNYSTGFSIALLVALALPAAAADAQTYKFDFGSGKPGYTKVSSDAIYTSERGYGFDLDTSPQAGKPFFFSVRLPEGNYTIKLTLGDAASDSDTTVKAESRRLMLESVKSKAGEFVTRSFAVNIRQPNLPGGDRVKLKPREQSILHWDDKLTLEFDGPRPAVAAIEIEPAPPDTITVYLAGDSTSPQPTWPFVPLRTVESPIRNKIGFAAGCLSSDIASVATIENDTTAMKKSWRDID